MKHILFATLLTAAAMATAEEAPRYDLTCGADVIGEAFYDGDELVVTVDESAACEGTLAIDGLDVTVEFDEDGGVVVVAPETTEGSDADADPDTKDDGTVDEEKSGDATSGTDDEVVEEDEPADEDATDPEGDEKDEVAEGDEPEAPLETALTGLDRADEVAGEHGRHGRDVARAAQGLDVDGDDAEDAEEASADAEVEVDVEVGIGLD